MKNASPYLQEEEEQVFIANSNGMVWMFLASLHPKEEEKMYCTRTFIAAQKDGTDDQKNPFQSTIPFFDSIGRQKIPSTIPIDSPQPDSLQPNSFSPFIWKPQTLVTGQRPCVFFFLYIAVKKFFFIKMSITQKMAIEECEMPSTISIDSPLLWKPRKRTGIYCK